MPSIPSPLLHICNTPPTKINIISEISKKSLPTWQTAFLKKFFILRSGNFLTVVDSIFADSLFVDSFLTSPAVKNKINFYAAKVAACRN